MDKRSLKRLLVLLIVLLFLLGAGCNRQEKDTQASPLKTQSETGQQTLVLPTHGAYTGAFVDFGPGESQVTFDALKDFEELSGKALAVVAFGNFWGDQNFPEKSVHIIRSYGAVPLLYWSPWDKPYVERRGPDRFNLHNILSGQCDSYIDAWAKAARAYGQPLLVTWGLEMNGTWFPWSGTFYGGETIVDYQGTTPLYAGPETFKKAYRYVIDRVRAQGANNILWGFHANNYSSPIASWNSMAQYYPGDDYVDWLGLSVYGKMVRTEGWADFIDMLHRPYLEISQLHPQKPIFLAEWGVGEFPPGDKAEFIAKAFTHIPQKYPRIRLAVYWHERWENPDGGYSNLRIHSSLQSLKAYRRGVADSYWLARPQFYEQSGQ